jgi:hypothetical protein
MSGNVALTEPKFEMVPNPTFSFPMQPRTPSPSDIQVGPAPSRRRPVSMHLGVPGAQPVSTNTHRRTTSALPSFSFNADNASGLQEMSVEDATDAPPQFTPRRGHKRGGSEFVGGDSRLGVSNALSTSPTRTTADAPESSSALPIPGPSGRRGHAHRRSAAISSHDLKTIMAPSEEASPRLSSSLPNTPMGHPAEEQAIAPPLDRSTSILGTESGSRESSPVRPGSRRCVGFSDNVEIIPRPLSTISSEGSFTTTRNHSVNNSISSVISMGSPPPRMSRRSLSAGNMGSIIEQAPRKRSSVEISKRVEREGAWLKGPSNSAPEASASSPSLSFADEESQVESKDVHRSKHSLGRNLGFDRRKSEPSISTLANEVSRLSAISLQENQADAGEDAETQNTQVDRRSSTKRLKEWASSKLHRRSRDFSKAFPTATPVARTTTTRPKSEGFFDVPGNVPIHELQPSEPAAAETDLDAVFGGLGDSGDADYDNASEPRVQFNTPTFSQSSTFRPVDDDSAQLVDLDDAISLQTPPLGSAYRKQLHSATRSNAPNSYMHRRTESAPVMMPFDFSRTGTPQSSMADVFEEEEEDEQLSPRTTRPHTSHGPARDESAGIGISIVDADSSAMNFGADDVSHARRDEWEPERPSTSYGPMSMSMSNRLSTPMMERRGSSIMEETIMEEASPVEAQSAGVKIVADHEEPRAPSLTKSSDSSDTPTLLASQREGMFYPDMAPPMMTPETYQTSTFSTSSPGRPRSFDTPRLGTSASSFTDNRTVSSSTTGEQPPDVRMSVDDVPSLTSSRSTMFSTAHANNSHRDFSGASSGYVGQRNSSGASSTLDPTLVAEQRRKRSSIQSLSQLMGSSFGPRSKASEEFRPQTASAATVSSVKPKKEHRLKKLMFWRSKQSDAQSSGSWSNNNARSEERSG